MHHELSCLRQPDTDEAWKQFVQELARTIADLDEDEYLIVSAKKHGHFIQFAGSGCNEQTHQTTGHVLRQDATNSAETDYASKPHQASVRDI